MEFYTLHTLHVQEAEPFHKLSLYGKNSIEIKCHETFKGLGNLVKIQNA